MDAMLRDQANKNYAGRTAAGQTEKEVSLAAAADISQAKIDANNWFQRAFHVHCRESREGEDFGPDGA